VTSKKPILILQMQRMGDLILSYPLLLWLARRYPGHPIFVAAEESFFRPLMKLSPAATYFPWSGANVLKQYSFELVINLSIQEKAARLAHEVHSEQKIGPVLLPDGSRFVHGDWQLYRTSLVRNNLFNRFHWADLNALDIIPHEDMARTRFSEPRTLPPGSDKIGIFIGASEEAKRPSTSFFAELIVHLLGRGLRPVLFGGKAEVESGREIVRLSGAPILNLCDTLGLDEFSAVGQTLTLFITPDTGPMHLAAWSGLKCLNLSMGNVNPWETGPYQAGHFVLRADMDCAKGCWQCTRSRLYCHDPFHPRRVAVLAQHIATGASVDLLQKATPPGLALYTSEREEGLYHLHRMDTAQRGSEPLISRFWKTFFGTRFDLWEEQKCTAAWAQVQAGTPEQAETLLAHIPEISRQLTHGLRKGVLLDASFWMHSPPIARPFTGFMHMALENGNYSRLTWASVMLHLEQLIACCG